NAITQSLPMKYDVILQCRGDEIFFFLPDTDLLRNIGYENAKSELEIGDVAFWPRDPAVCIFFGRTPLSKTGENKPVAMEPVNVFGKIVQNMELLSRLEVGDLIRMEVIE
ncbi:MAG: cyclophilin-like family protein, partial [Candidatus Helarchaeota archaeon]